MPSDYLLEIDGIKGESLDSKHKDTIEIDSFSWGETNSGSFALGSGGGTGKVSFQDLHFTARVNKSSPNLAKACATGQHIKKATLIVRKAGKDAQEYYTIKLTDVLISSYQSGGSGGGSGHGNTDLPMDQFSLNYAKIEFEYKPQNADGTLGAAVTANYDIKQAKSN